MGIDQDRQVTGRSVTSKCVLSPGPLAGEKALSLFPLVNSARCMYTEAVRSPRIYHMDSPTHHRP